MKKKSALWFFVLVGLLLLMIGCSRGSLQSDDRPDVSGSEQQINSDADASEDVVSSEEESVEETAAERRPFSDEDMHGAGVRLGMGPEEVLSILGEPLSREEGLDEIIDAPYILLFYDFGYLYFYEYSDGYFLQVISIDTPDVSGPRGIQVGDTVESVLAKFPMESSVIENNVQKLYGEDFEHEEWGMVQYYDDGTAEIFYVRDLLKGLRMPVEDQRIKRIIVLIAI